MRPVALKKEILKLIEEDREFRYAVMGLLGMKELLERFARLEERQQKLEERQQKLEERFARLEERFAKLEERQIRLEERQQKLEERQQKLEERFNELVKEVRDLRRDFNEMLKRIESLEEKYRFLEEGHRRLEAEVKKLWGAMLYGFNQVRVFAGMSLEEFVRKLFTKVFVSDGIIPEGAELKRAVIEGEEINIFYDNPLIVGEVTAYADSVAEYDKFLRKLKAVEKKYGRKPVIKFLIVLSGPRKVIREIGRRAMRDGVEFYFGKEY